MVCYMRLREAWQLVRSDAQPGMTMKVCHSCHYHVGIKDPEVYFAILDLTRMLVVKPVLGVAL